MIWRQLLEGSGSGVFGAVRSSFNNVISRPFGRGGAINLDALDPLTGSANRDVESQSDHIGDSAPHGSIQRYTNGAGSYLSSVPGLGQIGRSIRNNPKTSATGLVVGLLALGSYLRTEYRVGALERTLLSHDHTILCDKLRKNDNTQRLHFARAKEFFLEHGGTECTPWTIQYVEDALRTTVEAVEDKNDYGRMKCPKNEGEPWVPQSNSFFGLHPELAETDPKRFELYRLLLSKEYHFYTALQNASDPGSRADQHLTTELQEIKGGFAKLNTTPVDLPCPA